MNPIDFNLASANALPSVNVNKSLFRPLATFGLNTFTLEPKEDRHDRTSLLEILQGLDIEILLLIVPSTSFSLLCWRS